MVTILQTGEPVMATVASPVSDRIETLYKAVRERLETQRHIPTATYRVQFNRFFTFRQAQEQIAYLRRLGVSDLYASPYFAANPGSLHGYDIVNHNELNPEIGT